MEESWPMLQQELEDPTTTDQRRLQISDLWEKWPDPRPGAGVKAGMPELVWLPVAPGGNIQIMRVWDPDTRGEEAKVMHVQHFDVKPFYIGKYLVTYAQYQAFVEAEDGFGHSAWWQGMPPAYQRQPLAEPCAKRLNYPRDSISWYQSMAFARWLNHRLQGLELPHPSGQGVLRVGVNAQVRLPTEGEWQWAAQNGEEARAYPWGESKPGYANTAEAGLKQAIAVGMYLHGAAACGALDMAGNLMEWCANDKANPALIDVASTASKVLRGGDWAYGLQNATCAYCDDEDPSRIDMLNGCRLVLGESFHSAI